MLKETVLLFTWVIAISTSAQSLIHVGDNSPKFVGCFKQSPEVEKSDFPFEPLNIHVADNIDACVQECLYSHYFRYAALQGGQLCKCGSTHSKLEQANDTQCNVPCRSNLNQMCGGDHLSSIYDTGQRVSGPPSHLEVFNITERGFQVSWSPPMAPNGVVQSYTISANLSRTHSSSQLPPLLSWTFTPDMKSADLLELHPGSEYYITIQAETDMGPGVPAGLYVHTLIGFPMTPNEPEIVQKFVSKGQIVIRFDEGKSENGPITGYRIVVMCGLAEFDPNLLDSFNNSESKGLSYYVTASLERDAFIRNFVVGDGLQYGGFDNVRLHFDDGQCSEDDIQFAVGVMSADQNRTCTSYSNLHSEKTLGKIIVVTQLKEEGVESGLITAIIVCSVLLVLVVIAYFAVRHFVPQRRGANRTDDPQEMCLQGPMIEVENYGYLPEEEEYKVDHYDRLKKVLWDIPRNFLDISSTNVSNVLGTGEFGTFIKGTVLQNGYPTPTSVQCIEDGALSPATKRCMLQELAVLINCGTGNHSNVIRLIGTCESPEMLYVVLEHHPATLKDILLESRTLERPGYDRDRSSVCSLPQQAFLQIGVGVAQGMAHLSGQKVIHKQLAACSVLMADGMVPKITNFGIAKYNRPNLVADFTRWTAREVFRNQHFTVKSDVWAMGCLLWEMAALGGTPYASVATGEVAGRVLRGMRPPQLSLVSDDLYQLMLQCWQLDLDERPNFAEISAALCELINSGETHLDWNVVPGFYYEQYLSELEVIRQR